MAEVVVAGHLCLDLIPEFEGGVSLEPGGLSTIRRTHYTSGGGVANVGRALLTLGVDTRLIGRVGDDAFGDSLWALLSAESPAAASTLQLVPGEVTSYTVVVSHPGVDRLFLHQPGCNDRFDPADIDLELARSARMFYLGYPPVLRQTYLDGGRACAELFASLRAAGVTTVLDTSLPDAGAAAGRVDWRGWLERVLPQVDVFVPSLAEALFMLERDRFGAGAWQNQAMPAPFVRDLGATLLGLGVAVAGVKLGAAGLYLRTAAAPRLQGTLLAGRSGWPDRELWTPAFEVEVAGTVGAGDAALAGFMASLLRGTSPDEALTMAAAVGASSVEAVDASSGLRSWEATRERVAAGWRRGAGAAAGWGELPSGVWTGAGVR